MMEKEVIETRRALEELRNEYESKCCEWLEAKQSLMSELMRKSINVGSLAFAVEGQVEEKSKWVSSLAVMSKKVEALKVQHRRISAEAEGLKVQQDMDLKGIRWAVEQQHKERKQLLHLQGNIRVFCRCRPPLKQHPILDFDSADHGLVSIVTSRKTFKFDKVFSPLASQADVFRHTAPFATSLLDGYNVCIFAYGQTATGKTFTMDGTPQDRGVNFRILHHLFCLIHHRTNLYRYTVSVSALEVYNEQIRDLLASPTQPGGPTKRLEVRQVSEGVHDVPGLAEVHVTDMSQVWELLQTGTRARAVGSTNANDRSSRSHCIHRVVVKGEDLMNGECTMSKLWLVDLAGSERVAKTDVQDERLKETQNINRSLSALGDVIAALATKSPHIPYRNSKLTHLLQDSLGGDSKTLMFVQISPDENDLGETMCSLNFASRVRGVELGPAKRQLDTSEYMRYKQLVEKILLMAEKAKMDTKSKDLQIKKMEETVRGLELKVKERDLKNKNLQDKVKELESQLLVERKLARQHVDTKIAEQHMRDEQNGTAMRLPLVSLKTAKDEESEKENIPDITQQPRKVACGLTPRRDSFMIPELPRKVVCGQTPRRDSFMIPELSKQPRKTAPRRDSVIIPFFSNESDSPRVALKSGTIVQRKSKAAIMQKRVRVSIGRLVNRPRPSPKGVTDKERGWNVGTLRRA